MLVIFNISLYLICFPQILPYWNRKKKKKTYTTWNLMPPLFKHSEMLLHTEYFGVNKHDFGKHHANMVHHS